VSISRSILIDIEDLNKLTSAWKEQEAKDLQDIVKRRIDYIQVGCACSGKEANFVKTLLSSILKQTLLVSFAPPW